MLYVNKDDAYLLDNFFVLEAEESSEILEREKQAGLPSNGNLW